MAAETRSSIGYTETVVGELVEILEAIQPRFVGGVIVDHFGLKTGVQVSASSRSALLINPNEFTLTRADGTTKDIDLFGLETNRELYKEARSKIAEIKKSYERQGFDYPVVSVEEPLAMDSKAKLLRGLKQWVSGLVVRGDRYFLNFGGITEEVPFETLALWEIRANGLTIPSLNPYCLPFRYSTRNPGGYKSKDLKALGVDENGRIYNKISLVKKIAGMVDMQAMAQGVNLRDTYESWERFEDRLLNHPDFGTWNKGLISKLYWGTGIGGYFAHSKPLAHLGDKFTG